MTSKSGAAPVAQAGQPSPPTPGPGEGPRRLDVGPDEHLT